MWYPLIKHYLAIEHISYFTYQIIAELESHKWTSTSQFQPPALNKSIKIAKFIEKEIKEM